MKLETISPSQVTSYDLCPRKWFFKKVLGLEEPTTETLETGSLMHEGIEHYYEDGEIRFTIEPTTFELNEKRRAKLKALVQRALKNLPQRGPHVKIEHELFMETFRGGPKAHGFIDLIDESQVKDGILTIWDHKSRKDFRWIKTPVELKKDPQGVIYSYWGLVNYDVNKVFFKHNNMSSQTEKDPVTTKCEFDFDSAFDAYTTLLPKFEEMSGIAENVADSLKVQPNFSSCNAFNRPCHFYDKCTDRVKVSKYADAGAIVVPVSNLTKATTSKGDTTMGAQSALEKARAKAKAMAAGAPEAATVEPKATPAPKAASAVAVSDPEGIPPIVGPCNGSGFAPTGGSSYRKCPGCENCKKGVLKEAPAEPKTVLVAPPPSTAATISQAMGVLPPDAAKRTDDAPGTSAEEPDTPSEAAPAKRKRRTKAEMEAARAAEDAEREAKAKKPPVKPSETAEPIEEKPLSTAAQKYLKDLPEKVQKFGTEAAAEEEEYCNVYTPDDPPDLKVVLVDTVSIVPEHARQLFGSVPVPAELWLESLRQMVAVENGIPDYGLADFGKGKSLMAAAIAQHIDQCPPVVYVSSYSRTADVFIEAATARGWAIFKAVRG